MVPLFASSYWLVSLTGIAVTIVAVLGLHVLTGLCGIFSIGQAGFVGVGAYAAAILAGRYGLNGWLCLPLSALAAATFGVLSGIPSFRLKGFYITIATLAAQFIILWSLRHFSSVTNGEFGLNLSPLRLGAIDFSSRTSMYLVCLVIVIITTILAKNIQRTRLGRSLVAVRDNELAAEVNGINIFYHKMVAFAISCLFAGVAGWMAAYSTLYVTPNQFEIVYSIWYIGMLAVGGMGSTAGVFLGILTLKLLELLLDQITPLVHIDGFPIAMSSITYGMVIIGFLVFQPRGLSFLFEKFKKYYRTRPYAEA